MNVCRAVGVPIAFVFLLLNGPVEAQEAPVGTVAGYSTYGAIHARGVVRPATVGETVLAGDTIETDATGKVALLFVDATRMVVGSRSSIVLDEFVFQRDRKASSFVVEAARGSMRFISGQSPKDAYRVQSGSATIGFRGTAVDVTVMPNSGLAMTVFEGTASLCGENGQCVDVSGPCGVARIGALGNARAVTSPIERSLLFRRGFPLMSDQQRLPATHRVDTSACGGNFAGGAGGAASGSDAGGSLSGGGGPATGGASVGGSSGSNPGNDSAVGNAGESPGGQSGGDGSQGNSDNAGGGDNGGGGGNPH